MIRNNPHEGLNMIPVQDFEMIPGIKIILDKFLGMYGLKKYPDPFRNYSS